VATNTTGANMPAGHVAALAEAAPGTAAVLEVDESYLGTVVAATAPRTVVLLNLSRDQLDRVSEVRMLADRWRRALASGPPTAVVVANADDPMVVWGAGTAPRVCWVGAGQVWRADAVGCPACGGRVVFGPGDRWACDRCDFARPEAEVWVEDREVVSVRGTRWPLVLALPGAFNRSNATMAAVAASTVAGAPVEEGLPRALAALGEVDDVVGRFATVRRGGRELRLLLAKNPAGWTALFDLLDEETTSDRPDGPPPEGGAGGPVVLSVNARTADGHDPSWLWDVPYERLAGRWVVATGDRRRDLAVRLQYAGVEHRVVADPLAAVDAALGDGTPGARCELVANYTAFADLRRALT
jgi:UDP-N-acetylmuramyl tripeptide synthase